MTTDREIGIFKPRQTPGFSFANQAMKYTLLVTASLNNISAHRRAIKFADALLCANHSIHMIFFYGAGAAIGHASRNRKFNEGDSYIDWSSISEKARTQLVLCVSSALNEGIVDAKEATREKTASATIASGFEVGGIGSLVEAITKSDRLLCFGG